MPENSGHGNAAIKEFMSKTLASVVVAAVTALAGTYFIMMQDQPAMKEKIDSQGKRIERMEYGMEEIRKAMYEMKTQVAVMQKDVLNLSEKVSAALYRLDILPGDRKKEK